jgi:hypothetical protein
MEAMRVVEIATTAADIKDAPIFSADGQSLIFSAGCQLNPISRTGWIG